MNDPNQRGPEGPRSSSDRRHFLRRSAAAAAAGVGTLAFHRPAEAQFLGGVSSLAQHFRELQQHENDHVAFLVDALGQDAYPQPNFVNLQPRFYRQFASIARIFENTGVGAYLGAAGFINDSQLLRQAASIALIEARHAGWLNSIFPGEPLTVSNESFETPLTPAQVGARVLPFFADNSQVVALVNAISTTPSDANDVAILRFALALEYLEATFYNLNVPRIFRGR